MSKSKKAEDGEADLTPSPSPTDGTPQATGSPKTESEASGRPDPGEGAAPAKADGASGQPAAAEGAAATTEGTEAAAADAAGVAAGASPQGDATQGAKGAAPDSSAADGAAAAAEGAAAEGAVKGEALEGVAAEGATAEDGAVAGDAPKMEGETPADQMMPIDKAMTEANDEVLAAELAAAADEESEEDEEDEEGALAGESVGTGAFDRSSPKVKPPKASTRAAEGYNPEALHVRAMIKLEKRATERMLMRATKLYNDEVAILHTIDEQQDKQTYKRHTAHVRKIKYELDIIDARAKMLAAVDPATHTELPHEMIKAAGRGDREGVILAFQAKVPLDAQNNEGLTALMTASLHNKVSVVNLLLELQADPSIQDANGATCLHYAVQMNHLFPFKEVVDYPPVGCNHPVLTIKDSRDWSALDYARLPDRKDFKDMLSKQLGGGHGILWTVFKGWMSDKLVGYPCPCSRVERSKFVFKPLVVPRAGPLRGSKGSPTRGSKTTPVGGNTRSSAFLVAGSP